MYTKGTCQHIGMQTCPISNINCERVIPFYVVSIVATVLIEPVVLPVTPPIGFVFDAI